MKCLHQIISFRLVADLKFSTLCAWYCALGIRKKWFQCCKNANVEENVQLYRLSCNVFINKILIKIIISDKNP